MAGQSTMIGDVDLRRSEETDTVAPADGGEMPCTLKMEQYTLDAAFGKVTLPADKVVGLAVRDARRGLVQIGTSDGQIVSGVLTSVPITLTGSDGHAASLKIADLQQLAYRITPEKPEELRPSGPIVMLRSGDRLAFADQGRKWAFVTPNGSELLGEQLAAILLVGTDECDRRPAPGHAAQWQHDQRAADGRQVPLQARVGRAVSVALPADRGHPLRACAAGGWVA